MATQDQAFKIRWGKLSLALLGALALVAVPVTFVVACFTTLSFLVPLGCALVVIASFVGLRTSAIRDRKRRAWARAESAVPEEEFAEKSRQDPEAQSGQDGAEQAPTERASEAEGSEDTAAESVEETVSEPQVKVTAEVKVTEEAFDFEAPVSDVDSPLKAALGVDVAAERAKDESVEGEAVEPGAETDVVAQDGAEGSSHEPQDTTDQASVKNSESTWSPRGVPTPTYVNAEPVERALPEAQPAAEEKKATSVTSIRQAERDRAELERTGTDARDIEPSAQDIDDEIVDAETAKRLDLDAVLQRRRA
ncbi:MAG: hypothetical protein ACTIJJ_07705 [Galactobacter sp.]|uniref:hypothetical protein n=1 Tax=Galactobacter sp. TaxID=2676125 RepID=UPI0025C48300|nr:hypothetical protein [Galactobacter sp.]